MIKKADILVVDDEDDIRNLICSMLEDEGYSTRGASGSKTAYESIDKKQPDLVILDIWLQGSKDDGIEILKTIKKNHPFTEVLMISGHGTVETAVSAIKIGAYDFIEKPFKSDRLLLMIHRALENAALKKENALLREKAGKSAQIPTDYSVLSPKVLSLLERAAPTNSRILLSGEIGTGKALAARYIHKHSERQENPFIVFNCQGDDPERLEAELFGHSRNKGVFSQAQNGTILLEEIDRLPLDLQGRLAKIMQDNNYMIDTENGMTPANIRFIASSSDDIEKALKDGSLREDLYYRLNVVHIALEPLTQRKSDFENVLKTLKNQLNKETGLNLCEFDERAISALKSYHWPGNIRQLRNVLEWVAIMMQGDDCKTCTVSHLPPEITSRTVSPQNDNTQVASVIETFETVDFLTLPLREAREHFERDYLLKQIERFDGNVSKTAQFIGMERSALHRKLKTLEVTNGQEKEAASS